MTMKYFFSGEPFVTAIRCGMLQCQFLALSGHAIFSRTLLMQGATLQITLFVS